MTKVTSDDIFIQLVNFPTTTKEAVTPNEDGSYTIFINARLSSEEQMKSYQHALKHIQRNDFAKENVQKIEKTAHRLSKVDNEKIIPAPRYLEELLTLRRRRTELKKQIRKDEERIKFLQKHTNMFQRAEDYKLYGNDL